MPRRRTSNTAQRKVARVMREFKSGALRNGRSGKRVRSRKQAVAIGLSEARRADAKVSPPPRQSRAGRSRTTGISRRRARTKSRT